MQSNFGKVNSLRMGIKSWTDSQFSLSYLNAINARVNQAKMISIIGGAFMKSYDIT